MRGAMLVVVVMCGCGGTAWALDAKVTADTEAEFVEKACAADRAEVDPRRPITKVIADRCPAKAAEIWQKRIAKKQQLVDDEAARQQQQVDAAKRVEAKEDARKAVLAVQRQAEVAAEAEIDTVRNDNTKMRYVFGASFCTYALQRKLILAAIAKDKKASQVVGVIDLKRRKGYKDMLEVLAGDEKTTRESMAERDRMTAPGCSDVTVQALLSCRDEQKCRDPWHSIAIKMIPETPSEVE